MYLNSVSHRDRFNLNYGRKSRMGNNKTLWKIILWTIVFSIGIFLFIAGLTLFLVGNYGIGISDHQSWQYGLNQIPLLIQYYNVTHSHKALIILALVISGTAFLILWGGYTLIFLFIAILLKRSCSCRQHVNDSHNG